MNTATNSNFPESSYSQYPPYVQRPLQSQVPQPHQQQFFQSPSQITASHQTDAHSASGSSSQSMQQQQPVVSSFYQQRPAYVDEQVPQRLGYIDEQVPQQQQQLLPNPQQVQQLPNYPEPYPQQFQPFHPTSTHTQEVSNQFPSLKGQIQATPGMPGQISPPGSKPRVTTALWEDEGTLCFQVEAKGICIARRADNNMINGTKLLNVAGMTRGRRDGILKSEKVRHVVKIGTMYLKGVWIPYERALEFAGRERIVDQLYPLFVADIGAFLYHPMNYTQTMQFVAAAQRKKQVEQLRFRQAQQQAAAVASATAQVEQQQFQSWNTPGYYQQQTLNSTTTNQQQTSSRSTDTTSPAYGYIGSGSEMGTSSVAASGTNRSTKSETSHYASSSETKASSLSQQSQQHPSSQQYQQGQQHTPVQIQPISSNQPQYIYSEPYNPVQVPSQQSRQQSQLQPPSALPIRSQPSSSTHTSHLSIQNEPRQAGPTSASALIPGWHEVQTMHISPAQRSGSTSDNQNIQTPHVLSKDENGQESTSKPILPNSS